MGTTRRELVLTKKRIWKHNAHQISIEHKGLFRFQCGVFFDLLEFFGLSFLLFSSLFGLTQQDCTLPYHSSQGDVSI